MVQEFIEEHGTNPDMSEFVHALADLARRSPS